MQRDKTISFWNEYHEQESAKEWILLPSESLLSSIRNELPWIHTPNCKPCVMEIGCGSSTLARDMYLLTKGIFVATDVSQVCIDTNQRRDQTIIDGSNGNFSYSVLNVLIEEVKAPLSKVDMVLDKGCLDTFLFRSRQQVQTELLRKLLDNVHRWLNVDGKYVVLSPRSKLTQLRDFQGFTKITRTNLDNSNAVLGDLDGRSAKKEAVYMHVCVKNAAYVPGVGPAFVNLSHTILGQDDTFCAGCGMSFEGFRKYESVEGRGQLYWCRKWNCHQIHCKTKH